MQFLVPQFIDTEDRIFGPISTRQFVEILAGFGMMYVAYKMSTFWLFAMEAVFILGLVVVFAFVRINGQGFHFFVLNLIQTLRRPKIKIWLKVIADNKIFPSKQKEVTVAATAPKPMVTSSRLTELSLVVDTGGVYKSDEEKAKELINSQNAQRKRKK
ncbi:MAG: PrgI family protein [Patescibacteria group bacterium]